MRPQRRRAITMKTHTYRLWLLLAASSAAGGAAANIANARPPNQAPAQKTNKATSSTDLFGLSARPTSVVVHHNQRIPIEFTLTNRSGRDAYIRLWFWPTSFGRHTDLHCFMMRCRDESTGKEVQYRWPPRQDLPADAQGKELPDKIPARRSITFLHNHRDFCILPPGKYVAEFQYDTRFVPSWVRPDKRAWHGKTNTVSIRIQVLK